MFRKALTFLGLVLMIGPGKADAQDFKNIAAIEDSLLVTADSMYNAFIPDMRTVHTEQFVRQLVRALKEPNSYSYPFTKLQEKINIIYPDDKSFRLFNWSVMPTEITTLYFGAIQMPGEQLKLYPLRDISDQIKKGAEDTILTGGKWYGAIYYRIIPQQFEGRKIYTMFGLNGGSAMTNKKVLDPMVVTDKGVTFGAPIFNMRSQNRPAERINRFIMEYKKTVQASLNWDKDMNAVYFDRLVSEANDPNKKYTFVPSGQYDGFRWNERWDYIQDLIPIDPLTDGKAPAPVPIKRQE